MTPNDTKLATASLQVAIAKAGGPVALAERLGITHGAVSQWTICPPTRVIAVERASGVTRHDLRPDIYPKEGDDQ